MPEADGGALARGQFAGVELPDRRHLFFRDGETGELVPLMRRAVAAVCSRHCQADQQPQLVRQYGEFRHRLEVITRHPPELLRMREGMQAVDVGPEALPAASRPRLECRAQLLKRGNGNDRIPGCAHRAWCSIIFAGHHTRVMFQTSFNFVPD